MPGRAATATTSPLLRSDLAARERTSTPPRGEASRGRCIEDRGVQRRLVRRTIPRCLVASIARLSLMSLTGLASLTRRSRHGFSRDVTTFGHLWYYIHVRRADSQSLRLPRSLHPP